MGSPLTAIVAPAARPVPSPPIRTLTCRNGKGRRIQTPSVPMQMAIHRALPRDRGMGEYWRVEVIAGRETYPPTTGGSPIAYPPRSCQRHGDRGSLYPAYYLRTVNGRHGAYRCCEDCASEVRHLQAAALLRWEATDGMAAEEMDGVPGDDVPTTSSSSAEALDALASTGAVLIKLPLPPEDDATLRALVARERAKNPTPPTGSFGATG